MNTLIEHDKENFTNQPFLSRIFLFHGFDRLLSPSKKEEQQEESNSVEPENEGSLEDEGDIILVEKDEEDGTVKRIVFTAGGEVDVYDLEDLCDKVSVTQLPSFVSPFLCYKSLWNFRLVGRGGLQVKWKQL